MIHRTLVFGSLAAVATLMAVGCSDDASDGGSPGGTGGSTSTGGSNSVGGSTSTGGSNSAGGSTSSGGSAGSASGGAASGGVSSGGSAAGGTGGFGGSTNTGDMADDFAGSGELMGYTTNNPSSLPDIMRVDDRYRANLTDNSNNVTLHFNQDQGRLDAKLIAFPFDVVVRNIGIGTQADSQTAPAPTGDPYIFAGVQVHVPELDARNSSHIVIGHRGSTHFTIEGKNTLDGDSSVNDDGAGVLPDGRGDIRIVGNADRTLTVYWQTPNPSPGSQADNWNLYRSTGTLPGTAPAYGSSVYVGLITYAFNQTGVPFVGTADAIEGGSL